MRALFLSSLLIFSVSNLSGQINSEEIHENQDVEKNINSQWTFNYFPSESADKGYESAAFDDSGWPIVSIPHTWNTYETTGILHPFISGSSEKDNPYWWIGWGWYRKHFSIKNDISDSKVFVRFEGVQKYCKVWINGKYLGDHKGGYGSFDFDLSGSIRVGADNVLAVAVSNVQADKNKIPPMVPRNFDVYGGIFRDVSIVIKGKIYIPMQGSAEHEGGTFITTPEVSQKEGVVRVKTWVKNDYSDTRTCTLQTTISDADGNTVQVLKTDMDIKPGEVYEFDQLTKPVKRPRLWSPGNPYLYSVLSEVISDKTIVDSFNSSFGFRWFHWDFKENRLWLNGKEIVLHGGGLVAEFPWIGGAIPGWIPEKDINNMKDSLNFNFLRTAFYPESQDVYDMADRKGLIVAEETPSINNQDFNPVVQEQQMKEMIRRDRNHPSIIFWSMGNETDHPVNSKMAENEDTTRILSSMMVSDEFAGNGVRLSEKNFSFAGLQVQAVRGWYDNDSTVIASDDFQRCVPENEQVKELDENVLPENDNISAGIYNDFGTGRIFQDAPVRYTDLSGMVDMYRIPKYAYYFWKAYYSSGPVVFIERNKWLAQYTGREADIVVITNCDRLELKVNGVSKGIQTPADPDHHIVTFKGITVEKGTLSVTGTKNGSEVVSTFNMPGEAAGIELKTSSDSVVADPGSVAVITANVVDENGNQVFGAANALKWSVTGPATLAGPSFYESEAGKRDKEEGIGYIEMPVSNVIRSSGQPGDIKITVFSSGLASGSVIIKAVKAKTDDNLITEPLLDPIGRNKVTRPGIIYDRVREQRKEIEYTTKDFNLGITDLNNYKKSITDFIIENNKDVDTTTVEFRSLVDIIGRQLLNNKGIMKADDYNYNVGHYNKCRIILGYIKSTKLPDLFKEGLRNYYAGEIIMYGIEKDAEDEMNWMNWIPSGGTVVYSVGRDTSGYPEGIKTSESTDLSDLIELVYPVYSKFSDVAKSRALSFISRMNPYVRQVYNDSKSSGEDKNEASFTYKAAKGKPVLIPELKFIAE